MDTPNPRARPLPPVLVLVVSLVVTLLATVYIARTSEAKDRERFRGSMETSRDDIKERMATYVNTLRGTAALFTASREVSADEFRRYVEALAVRSRYPGILGIGYAERVGSGQEAAYEGRERLTRPAFDIKPDGPREDMTTIRWLQPNGGRNARAIGYDMFSQPEHRRAMEVARDSGEPAASGKVVLVQGTEEDVQSGFLIYVPVYRGGMDPTEVDLRRRALAGWVYAPFRAGDLFQRVIGGGARPRLQVEIYASTAAEAESLLFQTAPTAPNPRPRYREAVRLDVAGHPWTLVFATRPDFDLTAETGTATLVAVGGAVISILLFAITLAQARGRESAERSTAELRASEERLREAGRAKDEFLAMLGHELRNPLAAVGSSLAVLRQRLGEDGGAQHALDAAERHVAHQRRLLDDLLDVSRATSGKIGLRKDTVDLRNVVRLAIEAQEPGIEDRGHRLTVAYGSDPLWVEADPIRLEQIVSNLLTNAIKYTPPGGEIQVRARQDGDRAELRVSDTGVGIPPEMLNRIFELFTQGPPPSSRGEGGLGLGLTLVRSLVDLHGGEVKAASEGPGAGATFTVRLPLRGAPPEAPSPTPPQGEGTAERSIVLIEDNPDAQETLRELLEQWGHRVRAAGDGPSGLDLILRERPDVALVDVGLPGFDGFELARRARAAGAGSRLIAVTGCGQPQDRMRAEAAGFQEHLVKPVDLEALRALLQGPSDAEEPAR